MYVQRIVNSFFTSNTYILSENNASDVYWLIDIGDIEPILDYIPKTGTIKGVFLTHTHYDHLYGINKLIKFFPNSVVFTSKFGEKGLFSDKLNFSKYHNDSIIFEGSNIQILQTGDEVELFLDKKLKILETPGHDWSCLTYYTENEIFTGDSFIPRLKTVTSFPRSNKKDAELSSQKILKIADGLDLYPGHGIVFQNFHNEANNIKINE